MGSQKFGSKLANLRSVASPVIKANGWLTFEDESGGLLQFKVQWTISALILSWVTKIFSYYEHSWGTLISFKIAIIFNNTSADFVLISADVILKIIIILKELRIAQVCSKLNGLYVSKRWLLLIYFYGVSHIILYFSLFSLNSTLC